MRELLFTTSWDDGHPLDLKLADLLDRHGCKGTFYVPCANRQGRSVLSVSELRDLSRAHEIGGHTLDHCYLDGVGEAEARRQIVDGKQQLEDWLGRPVPGFAYPGGKHNRQIRTAVRAAGFSYARTVECFSLQLYDDPFRMPTTAQFYRHPIAASLRNLVSRGSWFSRLPVFMTVSRGGDLNTRILRLLEFGCRNGGLLHLWGHSWEVDGLGNWRVLDAVLARVAESIPPRNRITNHAAFARLRTPKATPTEGGPS